MNTPNRASNNLCITAGTEPANARDRSDYTELNADERRARMAATMSQTTASKAVHNQVDKQEHETHTRDARTAHARVCDIGTIPENRQIRPST